MKNVARCVMLLLCVVLPLTKNAIAAEPDEKDVEYATVSDQRLLLDIYRPTIKQHNPLIVWVHGGAWRSGSKDSMPIARMLQHGFAIASVDYRLSPAAKFPANVHDIRAAIRFLRSNADGFNVNADRIIIAGASAGGHLAALVGVTNGVEELEGHVGRHADQSSDVQGIVSFYGASNLQTILSQSTPHGLSVRVPALGLLLGVPPDQNAELTKLASPVFHVDKSDPPLLLIHGDQDPQMPINQAHELHGKYKQHNLTVEFEVVHGGVHGGKGFYEEAMLDRVAKSLAAWAAWPPPDADSRPETLPLVAPGTRDGKQ